MTGVHVPALAMLGLVVALAAAPATATTLVLVRHAQKASGDDPLLTPAGEAWALQLAALLAPAPLVAIYVTDTRRSAATAAPTASQKHLVPLVRSRADGAAHVAALGAELRLRSDADVLLAVEHSDTVPMLLAALGVAQPPVLGDSDYGDVFIVSWAGAGAVVGARSPSLLRLNLPAASGSTNAK